MGNWAAIAAVAVIGTATAVSVFFVYVIDGLVLAYQEWRLERIRRDGTREEEIEYRARTGAGSSAEIL